ncbi:MAG: type II toxin-antitoxin system VapC family toxin [Balneolaceae bacterium]
MIVVDTNVIASMWVPNDMDEWVYKVLKKDDDWVAPLLWRSEFRNVLSIYLRKGILELSVVLQAIEEAEQLMDANEFEVNSTQVMSLVSDSSCSAYDCEFVALADDLNVPLVTFDKKILREFPNIAIKPKEFVS